MTPDDSHLKNLEAKIGHNQLEVEFAARNGMAAWHVEGLRLFCVQNQILIILRRSNPASRAYHLAGIPAKASDVKGKTGDVGVAFGTSKKDPNHRAFISDYDLLSVWERKGRNYAKIPLAPGFKNTNEFVHRLNLAIGGNMFKHGANDDYMDVAGNMRNQLKSTEWFLVFFEDGRVNQVYSTKNMRALYSKLGLRWPPYTV